MDWLSDVYQVCALVGGTLLVLQTLMMVIGGDGDHGGGHGEGSLAGHDMGHVHEGMSDIKWLSLKTVVSSLTFFGLAGLASEKAGLSTFTSLAIAVVAGGIAVFLVAFLMASLSRLQSRGNVDFSNAVGLTGRVYLRIPAARDGRGKVTIEVQGRSIEAEAVTAGPEIPTGASVRVLGLAGADTLDVISVVG
jgi:membrane protein implicated in regulation of membrane protease activity